MGQHTVVIPRDQIGGVDITLLATPAIIAGKGLYIQNVSNNVAIVSTIPDDMDNGLLLSEFGTAMSALSAEAGDTVYVGSYNERVVLKVQSDD